MIMKHLLYVASLIALTSCTLNINFMHEIGNGTSVETAIETGDFNSISSSCSIDVHYSQQAGKQSVTLTCDENLVEFFDIRVEDGTLVVDTKSGVSISTRVKTFVTVSSPKLDGAFASGSGDIEISGPLTTDGDFTFKTSGSGDIDAEGLVVCKGFSASISGSGSIDVDGVQAQAASFKSTGSGDIDVESLKAEDVSVRMSGSGDISLHCNGAGYIDANLSGSGDLNLSGSARSVISNTSGSGRVRSGNLTIIRE